MNEIEVRQIVRNEIIDVINRQKEEYEQLKYVLKPTALKAEIKKILEEHYDERLEEELPKLVQREIMSELNSSFQIQKLVKIEIENQLSNLDIYKEIKQVIKKQIKETIKPLVTEIYQIVDRKLASKLDLKIKSITSLKTSTIQEIRRYTNDYVTKDQDYEKIEVKGDMLLLE